MGHGTRGPGPRSNPPSHTASRSGGLRRSAATNRAGRDAHVLDLVGALVAHASRADPSPAATAALALPLAADVPSELSDHVELIDLVARWMHPADLVVCVDPDDDSGMLAACGGGLCIAAANHDRFVVLVSPGAPRETLAQELAHAIDMRAGRWQTRTPAQGERFAAVAGWLLLASRAATRTWLDSRRACPHFGSGEMATEWSQTKTQAIRDS